MAGISANICPNLVLGQSSDSSDSPRTPHGLCAEYVGECKDLLPGDIVDSMNKAFWGRLRQELVDLISNPNLLRNRSNSNGSHRLSSDSTEWLANFIGENLQVTQAFLQWTDYDPNATVGKLKAL